MNVSRRAVLVLLLGIVASWAGPITAQDAEQFQSAAARFSFEKPAGWEFVSDEGVKELRLSDEEWQHVDEKVRADLRKKLEQLTLPLPLVTIRKLAETSEVLVTVVLVPMPPGGMVASPKPILERAFAETKKMFPDMKLDAPMRELTVSGRPAAEYTASYTLPMEGEKVSMKTAMIVVPRGRAVFAIGLVVVHPGDDPYVEEFRKIVSGITIRD